MKRLELAVRVGGRLQARHHRPSSAPDSAIHTSPSGNPVYTRLPMQPKLDVPRCVAITCGIIAHAGRMTGAEGCARRPRAALR